MATLGLTLKYAARHWLREVPFVSGRSQSLLAGERADPSSWQSARERWLRRSLLRAARVLPAYAHLHGRIPGEREVFDFLATLPIVGKAELMAERERYYPHGGRPRAWWSVGKTSGSTATPLDVFRNYDAVLWEQATFLQHWHWAGWQPGQRQAVLRGDLVVPLSQARPPYWFDDRVGQQLFVSTRHLSPRNIGPIVQALSDYAPSLLRAYPSAAYTLAVLLQQQGLKLKIPAVLTSSEALLPMQRDLIESVLGARVFDHYGMAERIALGLQCSAGHLHVHPLYSHVEIVDAEGRPTTGPGRVVGTTFLTRAMPLLRYRVDDIAEWGEGACACGRSYPWLKSLQGRASDLLYDAEEQPGSAGVVTFAFKGVPLLARAQVVQRQPGRWQVLVVPLAGWKPADAQLLLHNFRTLVSDRVALDLQVVDDIPVQPSGKYKWISQEHYGAGAPAATAEVA
jgi:phenylacetate-CoA ligase